MITAGHKVGLELWAVKVLYLYAHSRLVEHTVKEAGRKALGKYSFSIFCSYSLITFPKADNLVLLRYFFVKILKLFIELTYDHQTMQIKS